MSPRTPFEVWLEHEMPFVFAGSAGVFRNVRDGMELAWDAAVKAAIDKLPGGDTCRPSEAADAIRALVTPAEYTEPKA